MKKVGEICCLSELKIGQVGRILRIDKSNKKIRNHLFDIGFVKDTQVLIKKVAPLGDPIGISLRDYELGISKRDLENIIVEVIK